MQDPLTKNFRQAGSHSFDRGIRSQTADHGQPRRHRLTQQRAAAGNHRLLLQRNPHLRRVGANRFAEESWFRDANHGEWVTLHDQCRSHNRFVRAVFRGPRLMAEHDDWRRRRPVVKWREHTSAERANAERGKIRARNVFRAQRLGSVCGALSPDAQGVGQAERRDALELRRRGLQSLVERKWKETPAAVATLGDGVVAVSDPVQTRRV